MQPMNYFSGMDNMPENNFFQITLSQQAANWLLRVSRITSWLFILGCISCCLHLLSIFLRYAIYEEFTNNGSWEMIFQLYVFPVFEFLFIVVTIIQIYYFYKFTRKCRKGIELQQADLFNESFQWLLKNTLLAAVMFILQLVFIFLVLYWQTIVLNK
jgi:hypothetical protein